METVRFIGQLYPKAALITSTIPDLDWISEVSNQTLRFRTKINNSVINVECDLEKYKPEYFVDIHRRAFDLARTAANLACFATGEGVIAVFKTIILPDGTPSTLRLHNPSLSGLAKSYNLSTNMFSDYSIIASIIVKEPPLFAILNDMIESITIPHVSLVNCGRIIDAIRRLISPDVEGGPAWRKMHEVLNISKSYQQFISQESTGPRHGDRQHVTGSVTTEVVRRTWIILDRYLDFRKRNDAPLTAPDFPQLV